MRPLEILTLILLLATLAAVWLGHRQRRIAWLPWPVAIVAVGHLLVEGYRWQMAPAYLLVALLLVWSLWRLRGDNRRLTAPMLILGLLLLLAAAFLSLAIPVAVLPAATGPYQVGTVSYALRDEARPDPYSPEPGAVRETVVQLWYPAVPDADDEEAPFIEKLEVAGPALARRLGLPIPGFLLSHINLVETDVYLEAEPAGGGPFPLLVFSHGLRGIRVQNTVLMRELASHGYVVAAIDHTYGNALTIFPDGRIAFFDQDRAFPPGQSTVASGARLVDTWADDVRFFLQEARRWNEGDHFLAGLMALERVGTFGHSTGGAAAIEACASLSVCGAVVVLDGWIQPVDDAIVSAGLQAPVLFLSAPDWLGEDNRGRGASLYANSGETARLITIPGTTHFDFTDIPHLSPLAAHIGLSGEADTGEVTAIINDTTCAFFDWHLKGEHAAWDSLDYEVVTD